MAGGIRGITVEIGGDTTKLGKALEDVNKKGRDLSSELGQINKLLKLDPTNTDLLAQKQKVLSDAIVNTRNKLDTLKNAEAQVQAQFQRGEVSEEQVRALEREIISATTKLNSYENAARETAGQIDNLGNEAKNATQENNTLRQTIENQQVELKKLKDRYIDVASGQGKNSTEARELKTQIQNLSSELNNNEKELKDVENSLDDVGNEMDETGDKGSSFGEKLKSAGAIAAAGIAAVSAAAASVAASLANASVDAAAYADEMLTLSTVTGISTDDLQAYSYAAELVDVDVNTLTKSMAKNIKSMSSAADGSAAYADAYDKLGISVVDANGNLRDGETVYWEAIDALGQMTNETERDAVAMQLFGKSAQELNPLIEAGAGKMNELKEEAREVGAVMSEDALNALGAFDDSIQRLKGSAGAAKNSLGGVLLPELQMLTDVGTDLLNEFTTTLNESGGGIDGLVSTVESMSGTVVSRISEMANQLLSTASALLPTILNVATQLILSLVNTIIAMLPQLLTTVTNIIVQVINAIGTMLPQIVSTVTTVLPQLINALVTAIPQIVSAVMTVLPAIINALIAAIPQLLQAAVQLLMAIVNAIPVIITSLIEALPSIITTIINALIECIPILLDAAIQLLNAIIDALPVIIAALKENLPTIIDAIINGVLEALPLLLDAAITLFFAIIDAIPVIIESLVEALPEIIVTIISALVAAAPKILATAGQLFGKILTAIGELIPKLPTKMGEIITSLVNGLKNGLSKIKDVGADLIEGLWNGIKNMGSWISEKIQGFGDSVLGALKSFFGIKSPSRVMRDQVGKMLAIGLGEGIEENADAPISAMGDLSEDLLNEADALNGATINRKLAATFAGGSAGANANDSILAKLDNIYERLNRLQIVLDSGTLVGETIDRIDAGLAERQLLSARGV